MPLWAGGLSLVPLDKGGVVEDAWVEEGRVW